MKYKYLIGALFLIVVVMILLRTCSEKSPKVADPKAIEAAEASGIDKINIQTFQIADIEEEPYVIGEGGSFFYIRKDALIDADGNPVNKNIQFQLKEVQTMDEFVAGRISTLSDGKLLSTAGSYYINATSDGKQLRINPEIGLNVAFPVLETDSEIQLFRGALTASGDVNWTVTDKKEKKIPKPDIKKPKNLTNYKGEFELKQAESLLADIDNNYEKVGDEYHRKDNPERGMQWAASYIEDMRSWFKFNKYKLAVYARQEKKYNEAYRKYLNNPKIKEWMAYRKKQAKKFAEKKTFFEYELNEFGWWNCDRFRRDTNYANYSGMIVYEDGDPAEIARVYLISRIERIHLSEVVREGKFSFSFPEGLPFQIYATSIDKEVLKEFDGSTEDLGNLMISITP